MCRELTLSLFQAMSKGCDYVALHDVDLVPLNPALPYGYPGPDPMHIAAPTLHPLYV
jgi:xylosylprotein 4-beta-galactosyltransferase